MQQFFLARQPILDRKQNLRAFELLFRSCNKSTEAGVLDDIHATAQVMVNAFGKMGMADMLGEHKGFINLDAKFLFSDTVEALPRKQVVLELLETIVIDDAVIMHCHEINLLRSSCAYPRGKTSGYYGAEKQNRRATLKVKITKRCCPRAKSTGNTSSRNIPRWPST